MVYALPVWTLLVWTTRIRNVVSGSWSAKDLLLPLGLTALAVAALVRPRPGLRALAAATAAVWLVRLPLVLAHHHQAAFKVVHAVLALVSLALAAGTWRATARRRTHARV